MIIDSCLECTCGFKHYCEVNIGDRNDEKGVESTNFIQCPNCEKKHELYSINYFNGPICTILTDNDRNVGFKVIWPYFKDEVDTDELNWFIQNKNSFGIFHAHIENVHRLLELEIDNPALKQSLIIMIYGNVVAAIEGYLSSVFTKTILNSPTLIRKFIEEEKALSDKLPKFSLSDIFNVHDKINKTVADYLSQYIFHSMDKVAPLFKRTLNYEFQDIQWLHTAVAIRHDCVHRAGLSKDGVIVSIDTNDILELITNSCELVSDIDSEITQIELMKDFLKFTDTKDV